MSSLKRSSGCHYQPRLPLNLPREHDRGQCWREVNQKKKSKKVVVIICSPLQQKQPRIWGHFKDWQLFFQHMLFASSSLYLLNLWKIVPNKTHQSLRCHQTHCCVCNIKSPGVPSLVTSSRPKGGGSCLKKDVFFLQTNFLSPCKVWDLFCASRIWAGILWDTGEAYVCPATTLIWNSPVV